MHKISFRIFFLTRHLSPHKFYALNTHARSNTPHKTRFFFFKKTLSLGKSISSFVEEKRGSVLRSRYTSEVASFLPPALEKISLSLRVH